MLFEGSCTGILASDSAGSSTFVLVMCIPRHCQPAAVSILNKAEVQVNSSTCSP